MKTERLLKQEITEIKGIGSKTAKSFINFGIKTVLDLLTNYPYRYDDFSSTKKINEIKPDEQITIQATLTTINTRSSFKNRRLKITEAILTDQTGNIVATWFNQPYLINVLEIGKTYLFSGNTIYRGKLQLSNPQFENIEDAHLSVGRLVPMYSLPFGISQKRYRNLIKQILSDLTDNYDIVSADIKQKYNLMNLFDALLSIHFPDSIEQLEKARDRLSFDELLIFQIKILTRAQNLKKSKAPQIPFRQSEIKQFVASLPFTLTFSQKKVAWEIIQDLEKEKPMNRLLQGDVGSGKTVVSAISAYSASLANYQTALLAPTEILAEQHFATIEKLLKPYNIKIVLLTGSVKNKESIYKDISDGTAQIVIGTHALLNEKVIFNKLGLLVVDEQHRFGVKQRATLISGKKGTNSKSSLVPHLLSMTATPIPRTLALTIYGDLDISSITELPAGRQKVITTLVPYHKRQRAYALIREELSLGHQCFVICPLVLDSDILEVKSATAERDRLAKEVFSDFSVGLIHGQMKSQDKQKIMQEFKEGIHHILVSTSVIEVGIDIPNATVVLIEGAERFGLAQLHQFRGRVGRSEKQSYCIIIPSTDEIPQRLNALTKHHNGFILAELDLKYRGMGQIVGTRQSGFADFKIADPSNLNLVKLARLVALEILQKDPQLKKHLHIAELINTEDLHGE